MNQPIFVDHESAHSQPKCLFPEQWSEEASTLAAAIDRRFAWDDSIKVAIRWELGNRHQLCLHMRARGLAFHMSTDLTRWWLVRGSARGQQPVDRIIANAFKQLVRGALFEMRP